MSLHCTITTIPFVISKSCVEIVRLCKYPVIPKFSPSNFSIHLFLLQETVLYVMFAKY